VLLYQTFIWISNTLSKEKENKILLFRIVYKSWTNNNRHEIIRGKATRDRRDHRTRGRHATFSFLDEKYRWNDKLRTVQVSERESRNVAERSRKIVTAVQQPVQPQANKSRTVMC